MKGLPEQAEMADQQNTVPMMSAGRAWRASTPDDRARQVLDLAADVLSNLDLDSVLTRVLDAARELADAQYAALGVLDPSRTKLERFITVGIDEDGRRAIGPLPTGRGVLGELIENPQPLRLRDVGSHPKSYGFPAGHPPMDAFLGVPVIVDGEPFGNLYLTEKRGGEPFTAADEQTVGRLSELAGIAIGHARRYSGLEASRETLQRTVDALEATMQIARALGGETSLPTILELVAKRGRALVSARALVIEYQSGGALTVAAAAGDLPDDLMGRTIDLEDSVASAAIRTHRTLKLEDEPNRARFERHGLGRFGLRASAGLVVPLVFRGHAHGVLIAVDRLKSGPAFTAEDQRLLEAFAASAATAIATAETFASERRRQRLAATEQERARWARELHDETLQSLAAIKLGLAAQLRARNPEKLAGTVTEVVRQLEQEIVALRVLIADLRPAALDELGLEAAVNDLAARASAQGLAVTTDLDFAFESGRRPDRLTNELELAVYRITQEALTNARKHGDAHTATVAIDETDAHVRVTVTDDGHGFDTVAHTQGFGLLGMRERAELLGGDVSVHSVVGEGTRVVATFPVERRLAQTA